MDIAATTAPRSDQQNFDDYIAGPRTVTITEVKAGSSEQPVEVHLAEFPGRPYKPSKSMRRVLVAAWGPEASEYSGRRMQLVGDPRCAECCTGGDYSDDDQQVDMDAAEHNEENQRMTATEHVIQFKQGPPRGPLNRLVTPVCNQCGSLGGQMHVEDAKEVKHRHTRDTRPIVDVDEVVA